MVGVKVLISWERDPSPLEASFAYFLTDYFHGCNCSSVQIDSERGGKLNYLRAKLSSSQLFSPASYPNFVDSCAFLRQEDEENWVVVCEWTTLQQACEQLSQPIGSFLLMCQGGNVSSVQKPRYESRCQEMRLEPYPKLNVALPFPKRTQIPTNPPVSQGDSPLPPQPQNLVPPSGECTPVHQEEEKSPDPPLVFAPREVKPSVLPLGLLGKQLKDSEAQINAKTKDAEAAIAARIAQIPTQALTDPNLQGEAVGREVSRDLQLLVEGKERAAKDLCMQASKQVAASMTELVRATREAEQDYSTVVGGFDQQVQALAYRLQQVGQQLADAKAGASIQAELAQLEAEIQGFEQAVESLAPPPRFPLRILSTCGRDIATNWPCPLLVIQWKDWTSGSQLRLKLDAQGGFQPSETVLTEAVTLLPYTCNENALLIVISADTDLVLCKKDVWVYTAQSYGPADYLVDWGIDKAALEGVRS